MTAERTGVAHALYRKVEEYLADNGMTKSDFHRKTGLSRPTIDRLATGSEVPQRPTVQRIARAIGLKDLDEAYELAGYPPKPDPTINARDAILRDVNLDDKGRETMVQLYDYLRSLGQANQAAQPSAPMRPAAARRRTGGSSGGTRRLAG